MRTVSRGRAATAVATVLAVTAALIGVPQAAQAEPDPPSGGCDRGTVVTAWRTGGTQVRVAAERALLGGDAEVCAFLADGWSQRARVDLRLGVNQIQSVGGPTVRTAAQQALDSSTSDALESFVDTGWHQPQQTDLRLRVNQLMAVGGTQVRAAAQRALDAGTMQALQTFVDSDWRQPYTNDQRLRVNWIMAAGGPQVRVVAQRALDVGSLDALTRFIDRDWAVAAARDQETQTITDLVNAAEAAGARAAAETKAAQAEADRAVGEAAATKKAAQDAAEAAGQARNDAAAAAVAAARAAEAADRAASAAQQAVSAARAASSAAREAAGAAARAAAAATRTGQAAARAYQAAVAATTDATKASQARVAAQAARDVAAGAKKAAAAAAAAGTAARQAGSAAEAAASAGTNAEASAQAAAQAGNFAAEAGADASAARSAAARASANASRARRAARAAVAFATIAADAAEAARDAANRAVANANAAAAAATDAADHAGQAAGAAARATAHANAALTAAQAAADAANQARAVYEAARADDAQRLQIAFEEDDEAAQAAAASMLRLQGQTAWDAAQASKRSAETNRLVAEALNPATPAATAVADARRVAVALSTSDGAWTRIGALTALAGSDASALEFVRSGIEIAAGQDDRTTLSGLMMDGSPAMRTAARAAIAGSNADVATFLRTGAYPERDGEDRLAVNQVLAAARTAGDPVTVQQAQRALDAGTGQAYRQFLATDQYAASAADQRVKVNQVLADPNSGPEVRAAAQVALDGPAAFVGRFLASGRHAAAYRDLDRASHDAVVSGLLAQAARAASLAMQAARSAQAAAATANGAAQQADDYAAQARGSAAEADGFARDAQQAATQAQESADRAAASANTATAAAASATNAARRAARSASWAQISADQAATDAAAANTAATTAYHAKIAAGQDAAVAALAATEAFIHAVDITLDETGETRKQRAANWAHRHLMQCQGVPDQDECEQNLIKTALNPIETALTNGETCATFYVQGSVAHKGCLNDVLNPAFALNQTLIASSPFLIAMVKTGETADLAAIAVVSAIVLLRCPICAKAVSYGLRIAQTYNTLHGVSTADLPSARMVASLEQSLVAATTEDADFGQLIFETNACSTNSFTAGTLVVLADGPRKPIQDVRIGDRVLSTDPRTNTTDAQPVTRLISGTGAKHLVDVTVDTDGPAGDSTGTLTATEHHPFWVGDLDAWVDAGELRPGSLLRTGRGTWVQVTGIRHRTEATTVHNLTVATHHTYYVIAGNAPVLVHNSNCSFNMSPKYGEAGSVVSPAGLIYEAGSVHGHRLRHVLAHGSRKQPDPSKGINTQFNMDGRDILRTVDEAWANRGTPMPSGTGNDEYIINMGERVVGTQGERFIKIIVREGTSRIVTAHPVKF